MHSGLEVALEARAPAPVALKVSCTPSNSSHWEQEWQLSHLQRAIEKWGQTWERVFSISSTHSNLLGPSTHSLWRVLERFIDLS